MIGTIEHAVETLEGETLEACLELSCGGGDGESFTSFGSIILGAHILKKDKFFFWSSELVGCYRLVLPTLLRCNKLAARQCITTTTVDVSR